MTLMGVLLRSSSWTVALAIVAGLVSGLTSTLAIAVVSEVASREASLAAPEIWFAGLVAVAVLSKVASEILLARLAQATIVELRSKLSRRILAAPYAKVESLGPARLLAALHEDASVITQAYVNLPILCVNGATVIGCLVYLAWLSWAALGAVAAALLCGVALFRAHEQRALSSFRRARESNDALFRHFSALTGGIRELKMHSARGEVFMTEALEESLHAYRRHFVRGMSVYSLATAWGTLLFYAVLGLTVFVLPFAAGLGAREIAAGTLALLYLMGPVAMVTEVLPALGRADVALTKWRDLGLALEEVAGDDEGRPAAIRSFDRLDLVDVVHRYPAQHGEGGFEVGPLSLTLRAGEVVFLVGGNGSGKTSLTMLLLGLYAPAAGRILLDGQPVESGERARYRQLFSVIFADYQVFEELLDLNDPELAERARHYLERLGLEGHVRIQGGRLRASGLSTGQRKRLALLVAALDDRPFYVFDEWASDQDPHFRRIFYREFLPELRALGKAVLAITHDDLYFDCADRCLRMDFGRLTELPAATPHSRVEAASEPLSSKSPHTLAEGWPT